MFIIVNETNQICANHVFANKLDAEKYIRDYYRRMADRGVYDTAQALTVRKLVVA